MSIFAPAAMILSTLDMATGALEDLPLTVPFPDRTREGLESVGGLTYDPTNDRILFSMLASPELAA